MSLFKKKSPPVKHPDIRVDIQKVWDDVQADYVWVVQKWQLASADIYNGFIYEWVEVARGDKEWALRAGEHYGIEVLEGSGND